DHAAYKAARPAGLSAKAIARIQARITGQATPAFQPPAKFPIDGIRDPSKEIDTSSPVWVLGGETTDALVARIDALIGCSCPVCENHAEVHPARTITTAEGRTVAVDAALAPLLQTMNRAGIRTTDSCQNLREAVTALWPERLDALAADMPGTVSYARAVTTGSAFIRMLSSSEAERRFIQRTQRLGQWQVNGEVAQLTFRLEEAKTIAQRVG
ncbi:hypothetical protein M707_24655, partial [Arthrobacter sp. AK-YN10]